MFFEAVKHMAAREGVNEQLNARNQMLCVQQMDNIRNRAIEMVNNEHCELLFYIHYEYFFVLAPWYGLNLSDNELVFLSPTFVKNIQK